MTATATKRSVSIAFQHAAHSKGLLASKYHWTSGHTVSTADMCVHTDGLLSASDGELGLKFVERLKVVHWRLTHTTQNYFTACLS